MKFCKAALAIPASAAFLFFSLTLQSQAPVEDRTAGSSRGSTGTPAQPQPDPNAQLIVEMQNLRQELSFLRGTVEELQYQIDELRDQQDQNYRDLDNRVRDLYTGEVNTSSASSAAGSSPSASAGSSASPTAGNTEATALYRQGFEALRLGERDNAINQFNQLVQEYPQAPEVPDALYWLGETYWLANRREDSRQSFVRLLEAHPGYRKSDDAKYRLGVIYEQLGDLAEARDYMQQVAQGNSGQAAAARSWLDEHNGDG